MWFYYVHTVFVLRKKKKEYCTRNVLLDDARGQRPAVYVFAVACVVYE